MLTHTDGPYQQWERVNRFSVIRGNITLSVQNNNMLVCSAGDNRIAVYSMSGEFENSYGTKGQGIDDRLDGPIICNDDDSGSVLIADRYNNRLQVMSQQGEFSIAVLKPSMECPVGAALFGSNLFVTSSAANAIYKYKEDATCEGTFEKFYPKIFSRSVLPPGV